MKKNLRNKLYWLLVLFLPLTLPACRENHSDHTTETGTTYTCPMHPQVVRSEPGSCPICGMDLVPRKKQATDTTTIATGDLNYLLKPTNQTVISGIEVTKPVNRKIDQEITLSGQINYDTRRQYTIPARFGGRIEKLYVQFNYQPVRKGQKLYQIYSPELVTAQQELIYLLQNDAQNTELIRGAKQKLRYLGVTEAQISQIARARRATNTFTFYSPYSGYVVDPTVSAAATANTGTSVSTAGGGGMGEMGGANSGSTGDASGATANTAAPPAQGFSVREGMYVNPGQTLFKIINADEVWAELNVSSMDAANIKKGTPLEIAFNQLPEKKISTKVYLVQPFYEAGESFAKVRALVPAQDKTILIGQLITGKITYSTGSSLWVPKAAVLDLGNTAVVFRKANEVFQPINITVGQRAGDLVEVQSGLDEQTQIAANAQFLVDSESFIRVAENK